MRRRRMRHFSKAQTEAAGADRGMEWRESMRAVKIKKEKRREHQDSHAATELDLNSSGERGDREEDEKREVKETSRTEEKKKLTTCSDKGKKERSLWLPPWCNVWRHALWGWGSVMVNMVPGSRYVCSSHAREDDNTNDREERILAVLGIIGTILNLLVVIIVYIYTSVT
ncbi:unnamed protein product [Pleuronectes platessa]|uniref:Uncharacterized protein n=1 Tax=Pleuronectes platessa TaxID=8262 RepID=A0A9N7VST7_PLEPL|nr:unnamed protein product [Pleuronectes platessa]